VEDYVRADAAIIAVFRRRGRWCAAGIRVRRGGCLVIRNRRLFRLL